MFNGGSRKRAMSATLNSVSKQQQHQKQQLTRSLVSSQLMSTANRAATESNRNHHKKSLNHQPMPKSSRNSSKHLQIAQDFDDEDEELIVDDDFKPASLQHNTSINLLNSQLFSTANNLSNAKLEDELLKSSSIPTLNLLNSVSNCHNSNKILNNNQHHPLATFSPFQNSTTLNNTSSNCMNDLTLQLNATNNLSHRTSNQATSIANNLNGRLNNGGSHHLDVVQAMLGQDFIWPSHHPLNNLTQLTSLPNQQSASHCGTTSLPAHLSTLLPTANQQLQANNNNSFSTAANKQQQSNTFPVLYSSPSLLFAHHNNLTNQSTSFNYSIHKNNSNNLPENWLKFNNSKSIIDQTPASTLNQSSAFKKVNNTKLLDENHFTTSTMKKSAYNDFSVENLSSSKSKRTKLTNDHHHHKRVDEVDVDVEGGENEEHLIKKQELKNEAKNEELNNEDFSDDVDLKNKSIEKSSNKRKKSNSLDETADRSSEELSDCNSSTSQPLRSQSVSDQSIKSIPILNLLNNDSRINYQSEQLDCNRSSTSQLTQKESSNLDNSNNKLIDLSNVDSLIKNCNSPNQELTKLVSNKELDLVNNIMAFNKLNEVMNRNYPNDVQFKEEIEKRIQLVNYFLIIFKLFI